MPLPDAKRSTFLESFRRAPELHGALKHAYSAGLNAYAGAIVAETVWIGVFVWIGVLPMAVAALAMVGTLAVGHSLHRRGHILPAFGLTVVVIGLRSVAAARFLGWEAGFHYFLGPPVVMLSLLPGGFPHSAWRVALMCFSVATYVGTFLAFAGRPALYPIAAWNLLAFQAVNALSAVLVMTTWAWNFSTLLVSAEETAATERERSNALLDNVLPGEIAQRLREGASEVADSFEEVTVLFADIVGFTPLAATIPPPELVALLDRTFSRIDTLAERHGVVKIKTIGDAYMAAAGIPTPVPRGASARAMAGFALDLLDVFSAPDPAWALQIRVGIATGPVVAGIIGRTRFSYDAWGDTVNTASRLESHGQPGRIQVDERTHLSLGDAFAFEDRGVIDVKGKAPMRTWFLTGPKAQAIRQ